MRRRPRGPGGGRRDAILALVRQAVRCPRAVADLLLGGAGIAAGVLEPRRAASAYAWATAHGQRGRRRWRTALGVLAHRGRRLVDLWAPALETPAVLRQRVALRGREHLDAAAGGPTLLLGFHMGSPLTKWALTAHGYDCIVAGDGRWDPVKRATPRRGWVQAPEAEAGLWLDAGGPAQRSIVLYRLRGLLLANRTVRLLADGEHGRELFRIPVPAGSLVVRAGWWLLRRQTRAVTLPVLAHREGRRVVVTVHPPLPPPDPDPEADVARCRAVLAPIVREFVRRYPDQCLPWVFDAPPDPDRGAAGGGPRTGPRAHDGPTTVGTPP